MKGNNYTLAAIRGRRRRPRREETADAGDARAMARRALAHRGDPGSLCRPEPGRAGRRERRIAAAAPARGRRAVAGGGDLVDAFRRHAGGAPAVSGRLSRLSDAAVVPGLRARGRRRRFRGQRRPADRRAARRRRHRHGRRHRTDALHRHDARCMPAPTCCTRSIRGRERGDRHRRVGAGALACRRPRRPAAAAPLGDRARRWRSPACITPRWRA